MSNPSYFLVTGRICGDEEDTAYTTDILPDQEAAIAEFARFMCDDSTSCEELIESDQLYITTVARSSARIEIQ